jgi:hypothetical protein
MQTTMKSYSEFNIENKINLFLGLSSGQTSNVIYLLSNSDLLVHVRIMTCECYNVTDLVNRDGGDFYIYLFHRNARRNY